MDWFDQVVSAPSENFFQKGLAHQNTLTKPPGSLGLLETIAQHFCAFQGTLNPSVDAVSIAVFAGDHGVCAQGVSAFPQAVTGHMLRNFAAGGAAINVLARQISARLTVINTGTVKPEKMTGVLDYQLAPGTQDFTLGPAMTEPQMLRALSCGAEIAEQGNAQLHIGGEMGIGNTTSAAALFAALLDLPAHAVAGPGTGLDEQGVNHKAEVIEKALALHKERAVLAVLQCLGGLEIAALTGFYIRSAQRAVPVLVDGFICTAAALAAILINPGVKPWLMFSHASAETAHARVLKQMGVEPLLNLQMRLGEGSGAAVCVPLLRSACALHNQMATFEQAGIPDA